MQGSCQYTFEDGSVYVGEVKDGQFEGKGILNMKSGGKFRGVFSNGQMVAQEYVFADGLVFSDDYLKKGNRLLFRDGEYKIK